MDWWIVVSGNPVRGFKFIGPFAIYKDAERCVDTTYEEGWIIKLEDPSNWEKEGGGEAA